MAKQIHYNIDEINKTNANYFLIYGEKSNGKSYQVKLKECIQHYLQTKNRFIILRRWAEDLSSLWCEQYFQDMDIATLTDNKYDGISIYRKCVYFANYDNENLKFKRGEKIGYMMSLSTEQHFSGASFLDVDRIIFEEFMERGNYIKNEPDRLMIFYSTIDRKRGTTKLYMVGNSISMVCPYLQAWGLDDIFRRLKQGQIETKTIHNEANDVIIAVEYCRASGGNQMAIGSASGMVDGGGWQSTPQPKLPKSLKLYSRLYQMGFQYQGFKFLCDLLKDDFTNEIVWFIYPYYKDFSDKLIVFSDVIKQSPYWQRNIYDISLKNKKLDNLFLTFKEDKIFYSDDLTGTNFKQAIDFMIRK